MVRHLPKDHAGYYVHTMERDVILCHSSRYQAADASHRSSQHVLLGVVFRTCIADYWLPTVSCKNKWNNVMFIVGQPAGHYTWETVCNAGDSTTLTNNTPIKLDTAIKIQDTSGSTLLMTMVNGNYQSMASNLQSFLYQFCRFETTTASLFEKAAVLQHFVTQSEEKGLTSSLKPLVGPLLKRRVGWGNVSPRLWRPFIRRSSVFYVLSFVCFFLSAGPEGTAVIGIEHTQAEHAWRPE